MRNSEEKNKKKFKLFDMNRDGKGVYEKESRKPTLLFFFKLLVRKFTQLLQLNLLMLFLVIPILVVIGVYFLGDKAATVTELSFAPLYGINQISPMPSSSVFVDMASLQMDLPVFSPMMNVLIIAMILFLAITFGWQQVGAAYVLRGLFRGDAVFVFSDYFYAIKRNFKQAFFMGLLDFVCGAVLIIDFLYFYNLTGSFGFDFMYFTIFAIAIIYIIMRFYMYTMLVTFDLKNFKIIKNSLIFTVLGIKRNIIALVGIVLLLALHILLIVLLLPFGITIPIILPFVYIMAVLGFIGTYAAYPIIDKHMIEPYRTVEATDNDNE
ncbi:MAG: YesL family protein [Clostridia bacterium]|nr:YesL family protein [Clostridia bacterium]